jgi:hypothetical protein
MDKRPFQPVIPAAGHELHIGSQVVRVIRELGRSTITVSLEVERVENGVHQIGKCAIPTEDMAWYQEREQMLKQEAEIMRLLNRLEQVPPDGYRHIPLIEAVDIAQLTADEQPYELTMLLMELTRGENIANLLQKSGDGLGEAISLQIGCQIADIISLAHLGNFQCVALPPEYLFWDSAHLMIGDWQQASDMSDLSEQDKTVSKQADTRLLCQLLYWLVVGQPLPASGMPEPALLEHALSTPLRRLLERGLQTPASFGASPISACKSELERLLQFWQIEDPYAQMGQDIQETKQEIDFLASSTSPRSASAKRDLLQKIDHLYEQLAIGKQREPQHSWQHLEQSLDSLWAGQLTIIVNEIDAGHFDTAIELVENLHAYPQTIHRPLLWRRRVAQACQADPRLAKERQRAVQAIAAWDSGQYTFNIWLNIDQKQLDKLSKPASEIIQLLQAELSMAALVDQFHTTSDDNLEDLLAIIGKLNKPLPEATDPQLLEARQQVIREQPRLEEAQKRARKAEQTQQAIATLEQQVRKHDANITAATFEQVLAECSRVEDRRTVYALRATWQQGHTIEQLLADGDIVAAIRAYASASNMPEMLQSRLQRQIARKVLHMAGQEPEREDTFWQAFDRLMQTPIQTPTDLDATLTYGGYLLPVLDLSRRKEYEELSEKKTQILHNLETLGAADSTLDTRIKAFHNLRSLGVQFLDDKLLADTYGGHVHAQQRSQLEQLESVAQQMQSSIQSLRKYESMAAELQQDIQSLRTQFQPFSAHALEREVAEIEQLMPSKEAQHRHHDIWENTTSLARTFQTIGLQRDYFNALSIMEVFKQRCPDNMQDVVLEMNPQELTSLLELAQEIHTLHKRLAYAQYTQAIGEFIAEQRGRLDDQIDRLLAFNPKKEDNDSLAMRLVAARRLLSIYDALNGGVQDHYYWEQQDFQDEVIARYLRHRSLPTRRAMLRQLAPQQEVSDVAMALTQPLPAQRWPLRAYAVTAILVLVILGLLVAMVSGLPGGGVAGQPASGQSTTTSPASQPTATTPPDSSQSASLGATSATTDASAERTTVQAGTSPTTADASTSQPATTEGEAPTPSPIPELLLSASTGTVELYQGESAQLMLTVQDEYNSMSTVTLDWENVPAGVTINGERNVQLAPNGTVVDIDIAISNNAPPVAQTILFSTATTGTLSPAETEVYLIVHAYPPVMQTALQVEEVLQETLAISVTQNVMLRSQPVQSPTTQIQVLPPGTELMVKDLQSQNGYLNVSAEIDGETIEGWISTQDDFTNYDPAAIELDEYPLRLILGSARNPGNQAAFYTTDARAANDMLMVEAQEADLLTLVPEFEPQEEGEDRLWLKVRLLDEEEPLEGWVLVDDTNYQEVITTLAAELGV